MWEEGEGNGETGRRRKLFFSTTKKKKKQKNKQKKKKQCWEMGKITNQILLIAGIELDKLNIYL